MRKIFIGFIVFAFVLIVFNQKNIYANSSYIEQFERVMMEKSSPSQMKGARR